MIRRYDTGETLRYVSEKAIRLPPIKRVFAYRVELCMAILIITFPICVYTSFQLQQGLFFSGFLLVGAYLLLLRIGMFVKYAYKYHAAGLCSICGLSLFLTAPVFTMFLTGVLSYSVGSIVTWAQVYYSFCLTLLLSIPLLVMMRSEYFSVALIVFGQILVAGILIAQHLDNKSKQPIIYPFIPVATTVITLKVLRRFLSTIIDPCLVIR
jgi:hypothetical protein